MDGALKSKRNRLEPVSSTKDLAPFVRSTQIEDFSLYWAPVAEFPVPLAQREWMYEFFRRLAAHLKKECELREEWFLQFKTLYPHLIDRFVERANQYTPMTGLAFVPGNAPVALPDFEAVKKEVEQASKQGKPVEVQQWMPDHVHWFATKEPEAQRQDFFGHGGMFALYLKTDAKAPKSLPKLPRFMTSHEAYTPDLERQFMLLNSLQDGFLAKSKELFGEPFRHDPSYRGLPFILPLLASKDFLEATTEQYDTWFSLFDCYCTESRQDHGILLAAKDPDFDEDLISILEGMRNDGLSYRS